VFKHTHTHAHAHTNKDAHIYNYSHTTCAHTLTHACTAHINALTHAIHTGACEARGGGPLCQGHPAPHLAGALFLLVFRAVVRVLLCCVCAALVCVNVCACVQHVYTATSIRLLVYAHLCKHTHAHVHIPPCPPSYSHIPPLLYPYTHVYTRRM
jgi:hypothetical protein